MVSQLRSYNKPLWITETNRRGGDSGASDGELAGYIGSSVADMGRNPDIGGVFLYELLDEPYLADTPSYGLVGVERGAGGRWVLSRRKAAFEAFKSAVRAAP